MKKVCKKCGIEKPLEEFELDSRKKDGHTNRCLDCAREYKKAHADKHRERTNERLRAWREANPEEYKKGKHDEYMKHRAKYRENGKQWYVNNKELILEQSKQWRKENRELKAERDKAYALVHKEKIREYKKIYARSKRAEDMEYSILCRLRSRVRIAIKSAYKSNRTEVLVGCSIGFLRGYLEAQFTDGMTWELFLAGKVHIDHIRPCASFDLTDPVQQRICFNYRNLQPLWATDNLRKHDSWDSTDRNIWANKPINDLLVEIEHI